MFIKRALFKLIFYDSTIIVNKNDINCKKTLMFLNSKIIYNLINDNDVNNFIRNCNDLKSSIYA